MPAQMKELSRRMFPRTSLPRIERENSGLQQALNPSTSTIECASRVARSIGNLLRCHVVQIIHETRAIFATIAWHARDKKKLNKIERAISRYIADQISVITDCSTSNHPAATSMYRLDAQYRSCIAIPIMNSSQKVGLVVASDDVKREWTSIEVDSICDLAAILNTTTAVDRERSMLNA